MRRVTAVRGVSIPQIDDAGLDPLLCSDTTPRTATVRDKALCGVPAGALLRQKGIEPNSSYTYE
jgi:hypothetical protein